MTPLPVIVRAARNSDLPAIGDLWEQLMSFHTQRDARFAVARNARSAYLRYLATNVMPVPDNLVLVAEIDGRVVGFLAGRVEHGGPIFSDPHFGYITDMSVDEGCRRRAVGRRLFASAQSWFRARGVTNIRVSVSTENPVSTAFWKGVGFRPFMERLWYDLS
ncbi:MAG TPA: GNAT family N-acetyltransferase [Armatimonadota bacterium]|jgi:ribosomal protein S18 acetylase RimI-like enzyme